MQYVQVFDNHQKTIGRLVLDVNNKINYDYFQRTFPDAVGLAEKDEYGFISIPSDENKDFTWNWNNNVVYDLIYSNPNNDRRLTSTSSSSTITLKNKIWAWMGVAGGIIILWIGGIIPSLYANIYEDVVKLVLPHSSDNQPNIWFLLGRALVLLVISILYIISVTCCTPILIKKIWKEITIWFRSIDIEELARNPLAPLPPRPRITTAS